MRGSLVALTLFTLVPVGLPAQVPGDAANDIGDVQFQVSCQPAVRADFDRAVALLHHMMYVEARASFEGIAEADPTCRASRRRTPRAGWRTGASR